MTPRERVLTTIDHQIPDRVPNGFEGFNHKAFELFRQRTGCRRLPGILRGRLSRSPRRRLRAVVRDTAVYDPQWDPKKCIRDTMRNLPQEARVTEWGVGMIPGSNVAFDSIVSPLKTPAHWQSSKRIPCPTWTPITDGSGSRRITSVCRAKAMRLSDGWRRPSLKWPGPSGPSKLPDGHGDQPRLGVPDRQDLPAAVPEAARFAEAGVDILQLGDDVGSQDRMILSASAWRQWFKPRLHEIIQAARAKN